MPGARRRNEVLVTETSDGRGLERGQGVALWRQIEQRLAEEIARGVLAGGQKLPTEATLAASFGVNRHTLRQAMAALAERGLIRIEQGRGTFVQENVVEYLIGKRTRFSEIISRQNRQAVGFLLRSARIEADEEIARELGVRRRTPCLFLETFHEVDGQALSLNSGFFPASRFPDLIAVYQETRSITKAFARHGLEDYWRKVTRVTARMPTDEEAAQLRQARTRPVLTVESVNVDGAGKAVQFSRTRFAADRTQLIFQT